MRTHHETIRLPIPFHVGTLDNQSFLPLSSPTFHQRFRVHGYWVRCVRKLGLAKPGNFYIG